MKEKASRNVKQVDEMIAIYEWTCSVSMPVLPSPHAIFRNRLKFPMSDQAFCNSQWKSKEQIELA